MNDASEKRAPEASEKKERQPYVAPEIRRIQLAVDEALMSICKSGLGEGPISPGCFGEGGSCMGGGS
jgi:hypothetical protein